MFSIWTHVQYGRRFRSFARSCVQTGPGTAGMKLKTRSCDSERRLRQHRNVNWTDPSSFPPRISVFEFEMYRAHVNINSIVRGIFILNC